MSSLAKLSIRGVRAFGPDEDEQVVEFFFPFTIIVGQNGCGKTTIIECLKYAITGGLPPGNKSGQAFVHDPRQSGNKQTKASVKLRFTSRSGQTAVVLRSMELTQNKTTLSFKQLDGVIRTAHPDTGERVSLSHKCTELDSQLPAMLGISKAILDSVLFCHQEESSWPLQEGAVLKKKFDDIFDSTRYTKALDAFRKKEKELASKCKDIKVDLAGLESTKNAVEGYRRELAEQEDLEEQLSADKKDINKRLEAADKKILYFTKVGDRVASVFATHSDIQSRLNEHKAALKRMRNMVEEDLTDSHTLENLAAMLEGFDDRMSDQKAEEHRLERQMQEINEQIESLHKSEMDMKSKIGKLESEKDIYERQLKERVKSMESIASAYNINLQELTQTQQTNTSYLGSLTATSQSVETAQLLEISAEDMQCFFRKTKKIENLLKEAALKHRQNVQQEEDSLQSSINKLSGELSALEKDKDNITTRKREFRDELNHLQKVLSTSSRMRRGEVDEARKNAERLAKERDEANNNPRLQEIDVDMRQIEDKWDNLKRKQTGLKVELDTLQESADAYTAIATLEEELERETEMLKDSVKESSRLLGRCNLQDFVELTPTVEDGVNSIVAAVQEKLNKAQTQLDKATDAYKKQESLVAGQSGAIIAARQNLDSLEDQFRLLEGCVAKVRLIIAKMKEMPGDINGDKLDLDKATPDELRIYLDKMFEEWSSLASGIDETLLNLVLKKLLEPVEAKKRGNCPCCEQAIDTDEKWTKLSESVNRLKATGSPLLVASGGPQAVRLRDEYRGLRERFAEQSSDLMNYYRLQTEIEKQKSEFDQLSKQVENEKQVLEKLKETMEDCKANVDTLTELIRAGDRWKDASWRIAQKTVTIDEKRNDLKNSSLPSSGARARKIVDREYTEVTDEIDRLSNQKTELNNEASKLNQLLSQLAQQALTAENRAREKAAAFADTEKATERKTELDDLLESLKKNESTIHNDVLSLRSKIREQEIRKQTIRGNAAAEEQKLQSNIQEFDLSMKHLGTLTYQIDQYATSDKPSEQRRIGSILADYADQVQSCKASLVSLQPQLDSIRSIVNDHERRKRQLEYNIQMLEERNIITELRNQKKVTEAELQQIEYHDTVSDELRDAQDDKTKLLEAKNQMEGRFSEIVDRIRGLKRKLMQPEHRDVDKKHRNAKVEYETTHMAADDLKTYQKALDSALLQFHAKKLAEINSAVRQLWMACYKGEDITSIEIQSGQEPGARAQKSYNYRVVMSKGATELDMRGRCSAGQRVLACIVIRLALAESFGISCGCIALDEPTVNLDYENKKGLAIALAQIIATRSQQRNFQLILITHDEDFVSMMKTELAALTGFSMPEKYFQVMREAGADGKLYSKIRAVDWDNL